MKIKQVLSRVAFAAIVSSGIGAFAPGWAQVPEAPDAPIAAQAGVPTCLGLVATIVGGPGNDTLVGGAGADVIVGLGGDDEIYGGGGADVICGGPGADFLDGEGGNDRLNGGNGDDTLADQGGGTDTADYTDSPAGTIIRLNNFGGVTSDGWGNTDSIDNVENADGSLYADEIHGDDFVNRIEAKAGDDVVYGHQGDDTLFGGPDVDVIHGGLGVDACTAETLFGCP